MSFRRAIPVYDTHLRDPKRKLKLKSPYALHFCNLMKIEEFQMQKDIKQFDLFFLRVIHNRFAGGDRFTELSFHVPGASENRPALIRGDQIFLRPSSVPEIEIETRVVNIKENEVTVVAPKFRLIVRNERAVEQEYLYEIDSFHVRFGYHRFGLRLIFDSLYRLDPFLYPFLSKTSFTRPCLEDPFLRLLEPKDTDYELPWNGNVVNDLSWFHSNINRYQKEAVLDICNRRGNDGQVRLPYVIFGPPGTGSYKRVTILFFDYLSIILML